MQKFSCNDCKKKSTCKTLCKKAEKYANQDWRERDEREIPLGRRIELIGS